MVFHQRHTHIQEEQHLMDVTIVERIVAVTDTLQEQGTAMEAPHQSLL